MPRGSLNLEGVPLFQGRSSKFKSEKLQNLASAKIASFENFPLYGIPYYGTMAGKNDKKTISAVYALDVM